MSLAVFYAPELTGQVQVGTLITLPESIFHHAIRVQRHRVDDELEMVNGAGLRVIGELTDTQPNSAQLRVTEVSQEETSEPVFGLVQALAKGGRDEQAIETATELGVSRVIPWKAQRSIVDWPGAKRAKAQQKWENTVLSAMQQSRRSYLPEVTELHSTTQITKLIEQRGTDELFVVLHESATKSLLNVSLSEYTHVTFIVGPEGGLSPLELENFAAAGAQVAVLGQHVMRSSTAGSAAIAAAKTLLELW